MPFTASVFAGKLRTLRESRGASLEIVSNATGIAVEALQELEGGRKAPSGDEVLILAEHFNSEFAWLIEDSLTNPDDNVTALLRSEGGELTVADRYTIGEFVHLCKSQALLEEMLDIRPDTRPFKPPQWPMRTPVVKQGTDCARAFRQLHGLTFNAYIPDVFKWLRDAGFRLFRRALDPGSAISGLFVRHREAGNCILINYAEDKYRQRFSAAHEVGHALMDQGKAFNISHPSDQTPRGNASDTGWMEGRANAFASAFLMPPEMLSSLGAPEQWRRPDKIIEVADKISVTIPALLSALKRDGIIDDIVRDEIRSLRLRLPEKREPELKAGLSQRERDRVEALLASGLHSSYVNLGLEAHRRGLVSLAKIADMFLVEPGEVEELSALFGMSFHRG